MGREVFCKIVQPGVSYKVLCEDKEVKRKLESITKVKNHLGLHIRPAATIAKILQKSRSKVTLIYKEKSVDARSIMSVMTLTAPRDARVKIEVEGVDAEKTLSELLYAFETKFEGDI